MSKAKLRQATWFDPLCEADPAALASLLMANRRTVERWQSGAAEPKGAYLILLQVLARVGWERSSELVPELPLRGWVSVWRDLFNEAGASPWE